MCFGTNANLTSQRHRARWRARPRCSRSRPGRCKVGGVFGIEAKPYLASHWSAALSITAAALAFPFKCRRDASAGATQPAAAAMNS